MRKTRCPDCGSKIHGDAEPCPDCNYLPPKAARQTQVVTFFAFLECPHCARWIAINGMVNEVLCRHCLESVTVEPEPLAHAVASASRSSQISVGVGSEFKLLLSGESGPHCPRCRHAVDVTQFLVPGKDVQSIQCSQCGHALSCAPVPQPMEKLLPGAFRLFGVGPGEGTVRPERPLGISCPSCGAGLEIGANVERLLHCEYCNSTCYLSDDVWRIVRFSEFACSWSVAYRGPYLPDPKRPKKKLKPAQDEADIDWKGSGPGPVERCLTLSLHVECVHCGAPLPLNGLAGAYHCQDCGGESLVGAVNLAHILADLSEDSQPLFSDFRIHHYWSDSPRCRNCHLHVQIAQYVDDPPDEINCPHCGEPVPHLPVPRWMRKQLPGARHLFGADAEDVLTQPQSAAHSGSTSFVMSCSTCGKKVEQNVDASTARTSLCESCGATVLLPAEVWRRYHPVKKLHRWTLSYAGPKLKMKRSPIRYVTEPIGDFLWWHLGDFWDAVKEKTGRLARRMHTRHRALTLTLRVRCEFCGRNVPVNGPVQSVICSGCRTVHRLSTRGIAAPLAAASSCRKAGHEEIGTILLGSPYQFEVQYRSKTVPCAKCAEPIRIPKRALAKGRSVSVACRKCGYTVGGGPVPEGLGDALPEAVGMFNAQNDPEAISPEARSGDPAPTPVAGAAVQEINCPGCSGDLTIEPDCDRTLPCEHCGLEVFIPDHIWLSLNPIETQRAWTIIHRGPKMTYDEDF